MMRRSLIAVGLSLMVLAGCQHKKPAVVVAPPASAETAQVIRAGYAKIDPNSKVGLIVALLPVSGLLAVGDVQVNDFAEGDVLVLIDSQQKIIGAGKVVARTSDLLHVSYDIVGPDGREPQVGDLAVKTRFQ